MARPRLRKGVRLAGRGVFGVLALAGVLETIQGAPSLATWLGDLGVARPPWVGIAAGIVLTLFCAVLAAGPHRVAQVGAALRAPGGNAAPAARRIAPVTPSALADEFSDWVLAKRAALPNLTGTSVHMFISGRRMTRPSDSAESARYKGTCDEVQRRAREEYHERFRKQIMAIVGPDKASSPQTIPDLEELAEMVRANATNHPEDDRP